MQNKLLYSISLNTAAELLKFRANADLPFMGLQSFKGVRPLKSEAVIAKNYLTSEEIKRFNLMVSGYLDRAELLVFKRKQMYKKDWVKELTGFIQYQEMPQLYDKGKVSHKEAKKYVEVEYEKYRKMAFKDLTQIEKDFITTIHQTYELLEKNKPKKNKK
jgi:hypothetical protein